MPKQPDLIGLEEIAAMHGVAKNTVWRWSQRDGFPEPAMRASGRIPLWRRADVERWAKKTLPLRPGPPPKP